MQEQFVGQAAQYPPSKFPNTPPTLKVACIDVSSLEQSQFAVLPSFKRIVMWG